MLHIYIFIYLFFFLLIFFYKWMLKKQQMNSISYI